MDAKAQLMKQIRSGTFPSKVDDLKDLEAIIALSIVHGTTPATPPIGKTAVIACVGSCFAEEIAKSLASQGKQVMPLLISERWNTPFALRHYLEYAIDGTPFPDGFLGDASPSGPAQTQLRAADAYIITLGLSTCWFERGTNRMVLDIRQGHALKGVIKGIVGHEMRQTPVSENVDQIAAVVAAIRRVNTTAPIVFTLSPIPLLLSMTGDASVVSNTISKATLRVALHEILQRRMDNVFYWPSYEIIEWTGKYVRLLWGQDENDLRHLQSAVIDGIMRRFAAYYFAP